MADFAEPLLQLPGPLALVAEAVAEAPSVTADGIDVHRGGHLVCQQGLEVAQAVGWWHGFVVGREHQEGLRRAAVHAAL